MCVASSEQMAVQADGFRILLRHPNPLKPVPLFPHQSQPPLLLHTSTRCRRHSRGSSERHGTTCVAPCAGNGCDTGRVSDDPDLVAVVDNISDRQVGTQCVVMYGSNGIASLKDRHPVMISTSSRGRHQRERPYEHQLFITSSYSSSPPSSPP